MKLTRIFQNHFQRSSFNIQYHSRHSRDMIGVTFEIYVSIVNGQCRSIRLNRFSQEFGWGRYVRCFDVLENNIIDVKK